MTTKAQERIWGLIEPFYTLDVVIVTQLYIFVKIHRILLRRVNLLYINYTLIKIILKKPKPSKIFNCFTVGLGKSHSSGIYFDTDV